MERREIVFRGRVQGVGFRWAAQEIARAHTVTGRIRNEPDGSVRLAVQGPPGEVAAVLAALREKMRGNILEEETVQSPVRELEEGFEIER